MAHGKSLELNKIPKNTGKMIFISKDKGFKEGKKNIVESVFGSDIAGKGKQCNLNKQKEI